MIGLVEENDLVRDVDNVKCFTVLLTEGQYRILPLNPSIKNGILCLWFVLTGAVPGCKWCYPNKVPVLYLNGIVLLNVILSFLKK